MRTAEEIVLEAERIAKIVFPEERMSYKISEIDLCMRAVMFEEDMIFRQNATTINHRITSDTGNENKTIEVNGHLFNVTK